MHTHECGISAIRSGLERVKEPQEYARIDYVAIINKKKMKSWTHGIWCVVVEQDLEARHCFEESRWPESKPVSKWSSRPSWRRVVLQGSSFNQRYCSWFAIAVPSTPESTTKNIKLVLYTCIRFLCKKPKRGKKIVLFFRSCRQVQATIKGYQNMASLIQ